MNKKFLRKVEMTFLVSFSIGVVALIVALWSTMRTPQTFALVVLLAADGIALVSATVRLVYIFWKDG